jgi:hypothetical protein
MHAPIRSPDDDAAFVTKVEQALVTAERDQASAAIKFIEVGRWLLERKEAGKRDGSIPHGQWMPWVKRNFPHRSYTRLSEYMHVAEFMRGADEDAKIRISEHLPRGFDAVLNEVRKPEPKPKPEPARVDVQLTGEPFFDIRQGDVRDLIGDLPQVHCVITSPPYFNLITYGDSDRQIGHEPTVEAYIATLVSVFTSIPLHPLGSIFVNLGDTRRDRALLNVPGRFCTAMQAAGFQLIDAVIWAKSVAKADGETIGRVLPEPCAGRLNSTAYEPFFRFVRAGADAWTDTVAVQVARNNVEPQPYLPEDLMRTTTSLNGRNLPNVWLINRRNSFVHTKEHYGCFPPELVERPIAGFSPPFVNPDGSLPRRIVEQVEYDDGIGPRTFGKSEPAAGISGRHDVGVRYTPRRPAHLGWEQVAADATPGIVCDPFCGVGTTGEVALKLGRSFVGIDLYEEYAGIARRRCGEAKDHVRRTYGYAAVYEKIANPPAPTQPVQDAGGDSNVIQLSDARKLVRVVVGWDGVTVQHRQGADIVETKFLA